MWLHRNPHKSAIFALKSKYYMRFGNYMKRSFNWGQPEICSFSRLEMRAERRKICFKLIIEACGCTVRCSDPRHIPKSCARTSQKLEVSLQLPFKPNREILLYREPCAASLQRLRVCKEENNITEYRVFHANTPIIKRWFSASRRDKLILKKVLSRSWNPIFSCKITSNWDQ